MQKLQHFYRSINRRTVSFDLPEIKDIVVEDGYVVVRERFMPGKTLQSVLATLAPNQLPKVMAHYLATVEQMAHITGGIDTTRCLQLSDSAWQAGLTDWHEFWHARLEHVLESSGVQSFLVRDVPQWDSLLYYLRTQLRTPYTGVYALVHGDFYPGNVLVDENMHVCGVLDFSEQTMWGDPLRCCNELGVV
jgi:aminoglycoside phosphotransferase (APT) family kinase protein